jgi:hypothetical protein
LRIIWEEYTQGLGEIINVHRREILTFADIPENIYDAAVNDLSADPEYIDMQGQLPFLFA